MSIIKSIKQVLGLSGTASENHFWDGSVANQLSLKRGTPAAPGAELIKALNGVLSFPSQDQSLTANGYVKLPGGLIVQWGTAAVVPAGTVVIFPITFPNGALSVVATPQNAAPVSVSTTVASILSAQFSIWAANASGTGLTINARWIAIGY